ncbi:GerAB/ArcD/ProY family transporter [Cytobacillus sp. IB215665]|uniref:GerAB/ArcD/ProY family transporter n=1 Tax=Cytobacillus sp. IB215665 TaxID=3097357 RepID=UPI002A1226EB|nr:GerAB/ArcD/ProY family transporter [Cytobacillus sp. IB215665]MDX8365736.1 GerAB/ArcD/ProY family transporter [Cytobacillus sp. IB215665]
MQEKLHPYQVTIVVYMIQIGITIITLPRISAETFGTNGWIGVIIVSLLVVVNILAIGLVFFYSNGKSIFKILDEGLPQFLLRPFYLFLALLWSTLGVLIAKDFELQLNLFFYPTRTAYIYVLMSLFFTYWLVRRGIYHIAKASVVFFAVILMTLLLGFLLPEFRFTRLTPFVFKGDKELFKGGIQVVSAFLGYELTLLFIPYMLKPKTAVKSVLLGHAIVTFVYVSTCFVAFGLFSYRQLLNDKFPILTMLEYLEFPFIERVEGFVFHFFILEVIITVIFFYWGADQVLRQAIPKISPRKSILSLIIVSFCISLFVNGSLEVDKWLLGLGFAEAIIAVLLPTLLLLTLGISHLRQKQNI